MKIAQAYGWYHEGAWRLVEPERLGKRLAPEDYEEPEVEGAQRASKRRPMAVNRLTTDTLGGPSTVPYN